MQSYLILWARVLDREYSLVQDLFCFQFIDLFVMAKEIQWSFYLFLD